MVYMFQHIICLTWQVSVFLENYIYFWPLWLFVADAATTSNTPHALPLPGVYTSTEAEKNKVGENWYDLHVKDNEDSWYAY